MNFKITRGKLIFSMVIPLVIWVLIFSFGGSLISPPSFLMSFLNMHDLHNVFALGNISLFVVEVAAIYLIWSLFQKKE